MRRGHRRIGKAHCIVSRARFPASGRYWEKDIELDIVAPDPDDAKSLLVAEVKWRKLTAAERRHVLTQLQQKWQRTALSQKHPKARFEVFDAGEVRAWCSA